MAGKKKKQAAVFVKDRGAFAGDGSRKGIDAPPKVGQKRHSGHQPRDADKNSGDGMGASDKPARRKRRQGQRFREEKSFPQGGEKAGPGAVESKAQGSFTQEQSQFADKSREEPGREAEDLKEESGRKEGDHQAGKKGRYRRRRSRKYRKGERRNGEYQGGERRDAAGQGKAEKSGGHKEKADSGRDFQTGDSTFTNSTEKAFVGSKKLGRLQKKAEKAGRRIEKARKKLPRRKEYSLERVFDEKEGKAKYVLTAVTKEKPFKPDSRVKTVAGKVARKPVNFAHRKISEVEKDNSAVEGAHKTEQRMGDVYRFVKRGRRNKLQRRRDRVAKLEKKQFKKEVNFRYQKFLEENPEMSEKTLRRQLQKRLQKRRIKREYAKAKRTGQTAKNMKEAAVTTANIATAAARKLQEMAAKHAALLISAGALGLLLVMIMASVSSCGALVSDGVGTTMAGAYMSVPAEIDAAELAFSRMEMDLQREINSIETDYPDYDEYRYSLGTVGHDPYVLASYLSAVHTEFTAAGVQGELEGLFDEMYELALTPTEETRTRTVTRTGTRTVTDPVTGLEMEEEYEYEEEEEYTVTILEVTLTAESLSAVVAGHMDGEQKGAYDLYNETNGLVQQFYSPLDLPWHGLVSSYYGYRIHPISGAEQLHRGVDIAVPTGTAVYAAMDGTVTAAAYDSSYGNYVVIEDSGGYCTKYAHMDTLGVSAGQAVRHGDMIGTSGNTGNSTGSHLHIECMYNGEYYNPLFYFCGQ